MKLAILGTRGIPARYGGFETFAEEIAVRLADQTVDVTVYCEQRAGGVPAVSDGVTLVPMPAPPLGPLTTIWYDLRCLWHARRDYDVVYMLGYGAALFCWLPRIWGSSIWINMDGIEWKRSKWGGIARWYLQLMEAVAMRTATRLIIDADAVRRFLQARHGAAAPFSVVPYGADIVDRPPDRTALREHAVREGSYYLVVCRLEPENHVLEILRGYRSSKTDAPLLVIGDTETGTKYVRRLLAEAGHRIRFIGTVYDREKLRALRYHCRAYLHGHSVGGTNPSLLEALGCGNIVLAHDNVFNREVAADAGCYFSTEDDITRLLSTVESMTSAERITRAERSRRRIQDHYAWDSIMQRYLDLLNRDSTSGSPGQHS